LLTTVCLSDGASTRRRVVFGDPDDVRILDRRKDALFSPGRLVAYLVEREPARALFIFRTATVARAASSIVGVTPAVDLVLVSRAASGGTSSSGISGTGPETGDRTVPS